MHRPTAKKDASSSFSSSSSSSTALAAVAFQDHLVRNLSLDLPGFRSNRIPGQRRSAQRAVKVSARAEWVSQFTLYRFVSLGKNTLNILNDNHYSLIVIIFSNRKRKPIENHGFRNQQKSKVRLEEQIEFCFHIAMRTTHRGFHLFVCGELWTVICGKLFVDTGQFAV